MLINREFSLEEACKSADYFANLQEVVQTHPDEAARNLGMSVLHSLISEDEKSLEYLELLVKDNPNILLLHQRTAEFYIELGNYEKALFHLEKIIDLNQQDLTAQFWLCLIYYVSGEAEKAKKNFDFLKEFIFLIRVKTRSWRDD